MMIIEIEDRFCKVAEAFSKVLRKVQRAAKRGDAVHEVEEMTWSGLIEMGREVVVAYIKEQAEELPRPEVIEHEGKALQRLPEERLRPYVSAFGPTPFRRCVYAARETQRQEVVPLDAKLGMPESETSYLLQKWIGVRVVKESYKEAQGTLREILGFAPSGRTKGANKRGQAHILTMMGAMGKMRACRELPDYRRGECCFTSSIGASDECGSSGPRRTMRPSIAWWNRRSRSRRPAFVPTAGCRITGILSFGPSTMAICRDSCSG